MEYMPINLDVFMRQRVAGSNTGGFPFTPIAALDTVSQIASTMEYLHGEEVVHRDLKPNNILVSPVAIPELGADGYGKVKFCPSCPMFHPNPNSNLPGVRCTVLEGTRSLSYRQILSGVLEVSCKRS
jgi:serine/threonine protein kinase